MHSPEIRVGFHEFKSNVGFAVASLANTYDLRLDGFAAVFVDHLHYLPNRHGLFQNTQTATLAHRLRLGLDQKYFTRGRFPTHR